MFENDTRTDLELMVGRGEKILWRGKPDKKCYFLEGIFNPLLPFALIWFLVDSTIYGAAIISGALKGTAGIGIILFLLIHMMPVWIYLSGILTVGIRYKNTEYIITDKAVYASSGLFSYTCQMKPFSELSRVNIHRGIIDQYIGVGDVVLTTNTIVVHKNSRSFDGITIADIADYKEVIAMTKKLQEDIYSDTMYPNDLRPEENHGYRTSYKGLD